jgi:antitoxin component HigA of HigAB toxin-antitoxin module
LGALVQAYEAKRFPIDSRDPTEAIESGLAQSGVTAKGLMPSGTATEFDRAWAVLREPPTAVCPLLV